MSHSSLHIWDKGRYYSLERKRYFKLKEKTNHYLYSYCHSSYEINDIWVVTDKENKTEPWSEKIYRIVSQADVNLYYSSDMNKYFKITRDSFIRHQD